MRHFLEYINKLLFIAVIGFISIYIFLYITLSIPYIQNSIRDIAIKEISELIDSKVSIENIKIHPFNKFSLSNLTVLDNNNDTLSHINKISVGLDLTELKDLKLTISSIHLSKADIYINKKNGESEINIKRLIDMFSSEKKQSSSFFVNVKSIFIRQSCFRFDDYNYPSIDDKFDKNHINLSNLNTTVFFNALNKDSLDIKVKRVSFRESKGLYFKNISFNLHSNYNSYDFSDFKIVGNKSLFKFNNLQVKLKEDRNDKNILDSLFLDIDLTAKDVDLKEFSSFDNRLGNFSKPLFFHLKSNGYINDLSISDFNIKAVNEIDINGNAYISDLEKGYDAYLFGQLKSCYLSNKCISVISQLIADNKYKEPLNKLGDINFTGEISGFINNLVAFGNLSTKIGSIKTDILINKEDTIINYKGSVNTNGLNIGELASFKDLGNISTSINVNINQDIKTKTVKGNINGIVKDLTYRDYQYNNILYNADINNKKIDGLLNLDDDNGKLSLVGNIKFDKANSFFNFFARAKDISLDKLNIAPQYKDTKLSFNIASDFIGNNFDNAQGSINIDSLHLYNNYDEFFIRDINISALNHEKPQSLRIYSELLNAQINGKYSFSTLLKSLKSVLNKPLPFIDKKINVKKLSSSKNDFEFYVNIKPLDKLWKILHTPFDFNEACIFRGYFNDSISSTNLVFEADIPSFQYNKTIIKNSNLILKIPNERLSLDFTSTILNKHKEPLEISFSSISKFNSLNSKLEWKNSFNNIYKGTLFASTDFTKKKGDFPFSTTINILPSDVIVNDSLWKIKESSIKIDSARLVIDDVSIFNNHQNLKINGCLSKNPTDSLSIFIDDISLDYIFDMVNMDFIMFGGDGSGQIDIFDNLETGILIKTDTLNVKNFTYNDEMMGDLKISSVIKLSDLDIYLNGAINSDNDITNIEGSILPKKDSLHLSFDSRNLNVSFIKLWTDNILQNIKGKADAQMKLFGKFRGLNLTGKAWTDNISFDIDFLKTRYRISDTLNFTENGIGISDIKIRDAYNNQGYAKGKIGYNNFKNFTYDININIPTNNSFLMFNVDENSNNTYWGTIFGAGNARIFGDALNTRINVNGITKSNSKFYFALNDNVSASDYQFITFNDVTHKDSVCTITEVYNKENDLNIEKHNLYLTLQVDVTPESTVNLIMDSSSGDAIKGNGTGNLRVEYNKIDEFKLFGNYYINKGSYNFNFQDIFSREFIIKEGSIVEFKGNPFNTQLDINAYYQVTANLSDLDETISDSKELSRTSVPVQCLLNINGDLWRPDLDFDINLPTVSQDIDRRVRSIIGTQEMMNKQIIYLMVLNKFYTPDYVTQNQQNRYSDLSSVASSTLSSQLNNLLGQLSDNWNIGTNIRTDKGDFSDVEVQLALSSQLLNNRLLFNGNLGYKDNQNSSNTNSFIGDFDLEYLLNPIGTLRLKAYNHYNDRNYSIKSALTTQGVGVMDKKYFNSITDLFSVFLNKNRKEKNRKEKSNNINLSSER